MRFVHLTQRRNLASIRRNGLRLGHDLLGRGVCCMPLLMLQVQSYRSPHGGDDEVELTSLRRVSSSRMWRGRGLHAVVFQPRAEHWPADVYLWVQVRTASRLRNRLRDCGAVLWVGSDEPPAASEDELREQHVALQVTGPRGMGHLFRHYLELRPPLNSEGDMAIEVVFRKPIPPRCIKRIAELQPPKRSERGAQRRSSITEQGDSQTRGG